ncbi:MAG: acetyl-CoA carboxylase biotin carboxylase subunit [Melioribacteraceae bacterium]|nr:acetyl-CoA carboxylase biotin carboxylase subunit [Melioribacteraceae bacterium]
MIKRILIANRGEIAVRIINACKESNITSVAIYSEADKLSLHSRLADESYFIGPSVASQSYLDSEKIIQLALAKKVDAIHPGYGFLSENSSFIKAVTDAGLIFIGPSSKSVEMMGSKTRARKLMAENNVPIVPGTLEPISNIENAIEIAEKIGFPIMLKASAGGGGKGMRLVNNRGEFESSFLRATSEAKKSFGDEKVYFEKFIDNPKHIEVQIIADQHGNYVHLFERECSMQRRHQKVIEEAPSPSINDEIRSRITTAAIEAAKACNYHNAGTIEFLLDDSNNFYFLEMNTRLQVEHPVTEKITSIDLVKEQIRIANGEKLSFNQKDIFINGHSIECRLYAEDSKNNFAPSTGKLKTYSVPNQPWLRVDSGVDELSTVSMFYDPMLAKIVTSGKSREEARIRLIHALNEFKVSGIISNINFCKWILNHPLFIDASFTIKFIEENIEDYFTWQENSLMNSDLNKLSAIAALLMQIHTKSRISENIISTNNQWMNLDEQ